MIYLLKSNQNTVSEYFQNNDTVIIPVGAIESHGPHNPLGTDTLIPNKILDLMDDLNCLVAPTIPYGCSDSHLGFSGTLSLGDDVFYDVISKLVEQFINMGAKKIVFLNGHGGNTAPLRKVSLNYRKNMQGYILDWWRMIGEMNPEWKGGHGGRIETSCNMYIDEEMVNLDLVEPLVFKPLDDLVAVGIHQVKFDGATVVVPRLTSEGCKDGWFGPDNPSESTAATGEAMLKHYAKWMTKFIQHINQK